MAFSAGRSTSGMMPPNHDQHVVQPLFAQQLHQPRADRVVRAGQDRQPDDVGVLLQRRRDDLLGRLAQAGVDHLHARVPQRPRNHLGAAVVPIEPRLRDDDPDLCISISLPTSAVDSGSSDRCPVSDYRLLLILAPHVPQRVAHLADGRIRAHGIEQRRHRVVGAGRGFPQPVERPDQQHLVARPAKAVEPGELVLCGVFVDAQNRQRRARDPTRTR